MNITHENKIPYYSDIELLEFKKTILKKLEEAAFEYNLLTDQMKNFTYNGTDDTCRTSKIMDDAGDSNIKEELNLNAGRIKKFIDALESALNRIENKTYGICRLTGKLIPCERLLAVPHTTVRIEAKVKKDINQK